jgi:hypothetical protein
VAVVLVLVLIVLLVRRRSTNQVRHNLAQNAQPDLTAITSVISVDLDDQTEQRGASFRTIPGSMSTGPSTKLASSAWITQLDNQCEGPDETDDGDYGFDTATETAFQHTPAEQPRQDLSLTASRSLALSFTDDVIGETSDETDGPLSLLHSAQAQPTFHADVGRPEAEAKLAKGVIGSYLLRYSKRNQRVVLSVRGPSRTMHYVLSTKTDGRISFNGADVETSSLHDLLQMLKGPTHKRFVPVPLVDQPNSTVSL